MSQGIVAELSGIHLGDIRLNHRAEIVIDAKASRSLPQRDLEAGPAAYREARDAVLEIRAITVTIKPPHARNQLPLVTYNVVLAEEVNPPDDGTAGCWSRRYPYEISPRFCL